MYVTGMCRSPSAVRHTNLEEALANSKKQDKVASELSGIKVTVQQQQLPPARYVDNVQPAETFADSIRLMVWEGNTLRIEFCVTRFSDARSDTQGQPEQHPACRLVLTAPVAADLHNRLQQTMNALAKAGLVSTRSAEPTA